MRLGIETTMPSLVARGMRGVRRILSRSAEETHEIGVKLGSELRAPAIVLLRGALGSGKTTLVRGIAQGLGLEDLALVHSPSFALVHTYPGRCSIHHVDLYRLETDREIRSIGLDDFMGTDGVTIVEWAEKLPDAVEGELEVQLEDAGGDCRWLSIRRRPHSAKSARRPGRIAQAGRKPLFRRKS